MSNPDIIYFWKGIRHDTPLHPCTIVRRAPADQRNPGEVT